VDQVLGDCQTVIKNLGRFYRHVQVVSGATILGNGTVALILDPRWLVQDALREEQASLRNVGAAARKPQAAPVRNSPRQVSCKDSTVRNGNRFGAGTAAYENN